MSINATPEKAPYPIADYLQPSAQERSNALLANCDKGNWLRCQPSFGDRLKGKS